jgi:hypothetical protein
MVRLKGNSLGKSSRSLAAVKVEAEKTYFFGINQRLINRGQKYSKREIRPKIDYSHLIFNILVFL